MELRDYLRMLQKGWLTVALITALFLSAAAAYVALVPRRYDATAVLLVSAQDPRTISDLQQAGQYATGAAMTYALIVDSPTVLGPVAEQVRPQVDVDDLGEMVSTRVEEDTSLIEITVSGERPAQVAAIANATAKNAGVVIPGLEENARGRSLVKVQQIRQAVEPVIAVSPNVKRVLALGLIAGLCVGLATSIARQALDTRLQRLIDIRRVTDRPLLGVLPHLGRGRRNQLVARVDPAGAFGEALRTLRTNVVSSDSGRRSLMVAAAADDRDGALVPTNLAWSLAEAGRRVLLVDMDLRQNPVSKMLGVLGGKGLSDVLAGESSLEAAVQKTGNAQLQVLTAGTMRSSPSELLSRPLTADLLQRMEQGFDDVIVHAPPLLQYTDAAVVAALTSGTLVTVAIGATQAQELQTALTTLANVGVEPLGLVTTRTRRDALEHGRRRGGSVRLRSSIEEPAGGQVDWGWEDHQSDAARDRLRP